MMKLPDLATDLARQFQRIYGHAPRWLVAAPGGVNVIGEHTDYNDGFVLPMAIERCTIVAAAPNRVPQINLHSVTTRETASIDLNRPIERGQPEWANYVRGVM